MLNYNDRCKDFLDESKQSKLDLDKLTKIWYQRGNTPAEAALKLKELTHKYSHLFRQPEDYSNSREQFFERFSEYFKNLDHVLEKENVSLDDKQFALTFSPLNILFLHFNAFANTIRLVGSEEQKRKWLPLCANLSVIGSYAQTELAHGSNVQGLQTRADFDKETQEFILHTPDVKAAKFWPGLLGKIGTHCVCHARLFIDNMFYGIMTYIVQVRDSETHEPMPGVEVGDIGPKYGFEQTDNGYLILNKVRVPRENMLSRYTEVTPEGKFEFKDPNAIKLLYGSMLSLRIWIATNSAMFCGVASTIAIRYSIVRKQFHTLPEGTEGEERKILDYQLQQYRLFPILAFTYGLKFVTDRVMIGYEELMNRINTTGDSKGLAEMHCHASGFKAYGTWRTTEALDECRRTLGGHGYSEYSALPILIKQWAPSTTYEGDNTVLYLQTANFLLKNYEKLVEGKQVSPAVPYLNRLAELETATLKRQSAEEVTLDDLFEMMEHWTATVLKRESTKVIALKEAGKTENQIQCELSQNGLMKVADVHLNYYFIDTYRNRINSIDDAEIKSVLTALAMLYAAKVVVENASDFYVSGYLQKGQIEIINEVINVCMKKIRVNALSLVDSFLFYDSELQSALGGFKGDVYNTIYDWTINKNPMNNSDLAPGVTEHLQPLRKYYKKKARLQNH